MNARVCGVESAATSARSGAGSIPAARASS